MANHKSAEKRTRQTARKTLRNKIATTRTRGLVKRLRIAIETKNKEEATELLPKTQAQLNKLSQMGVIKKNTSARRVSRLASQVASL